MKIDLHCHTKATKKGDSINRNVTATVFKNKVNSVDVKIVGITNHNNFDINQYYDFVKEVNGEFMIFPGIELDVIGINSEKGHVLIVSNPILVKKFDSLTSNLINGKDCNEFACTLNELLELANSIDCIVMPHFYKPKALDEDSINYLKENLNKKYMLLYEPSNYKSLGILINHNKNSIIGSDVKDWNKYHENEFANLKIDVDSYEQFTFLLKKDVTLIETLLQKQKKAKIDISYTKNIVEEVDFYNDVNIIFGSKGTGKSEALKKVKKYFEEKGKNIGDYEPRDTQDKIDEKLNADVSERKLSVYGFDNYEKDFQNILYWKDENATQFKDYYNYSLSKNKNNNKEKMKLLEITEIPNKYTKLFNNENENLKNIEQVKNFINKIKLDNYLEENEINDLNKLIIKLNVNIEKNKYLNWNNKESIHFSNFSIEKFKEIVEKNTELKTKPNETRFLKFSENRLSLKSSLKRIVDAFSYNFKDEIISIGMLEEQKELKKRTIKRMLNENSKTKEFQLGIKNLNEIKKLIFYIYNNSLELNIFDKIALLVDELKDNNVNSMDYFLGIIKQFEINGSEYIPSTGEATMIILDEVLKENHDVYILDEPEKSLGNAYVNEELVSRINDLARSKKCVVIVTHNANVAVRTYPFKSVLKVYENGKYKTYAGNPYTNQLININDSLDTKDWKDESIKILEGGKEAFEERGEIYDK